MAKISETEKLQTALGTIWFACKMLEGENEEYIRIKPILDILNSVKDNTWWEAEYIKNSEDNQ